MPPPPAVVMDCRWLGIGGAGRVTEVLLRGLVADPPEGRWVIWGSPDRLRGLTVPGAEVVALDEDPRTLLGQRRLFDMPRGDLYAFMHQQRPLRAVPALTAIHDTIPLRYGGSRWARRPRMLFLRRVAATSNRICTLSEFSKRSIVDDLGVPPGRVDVLRYPFDHELADRVAALRGGQPKADVAVYVGNFLPHKNLGRLLQAFGATRFRAHGGRLLLVGGGRTADVDALVGSFTEGEREFVTVVPNCGQAELDRLFATSRFLVQPSLEEGFGIPVWEAMCCGLPVCVSDGGALPEVVAGLPPDEATSFPATSVPAMTAALDECAHRARDRTDADSVGASTRLAMVAPTIGAFATQFQESVNAASGSRKEK